MLENNSDDEIIDLDCVINSISEIMNLSEVAKFLKLNKEVVRRAMRSGKIPATKVCGKWLSTKKEILSMFDDSK